MSRRSAIEIIQRQRELFIDESIGVKRAIALSLVKTAMHQGVTPLTLVEETGLFVVGAPEDWVSAAYGSAGYVFNHLIPLVGIPNSFRGEVLLTALADFYAVVNQQRVVYKSSTSVSDDQLLGLASKAGRFCIVIGDK